MDASDTSVRVFVGLGSNHEPQANLVRALAWLGERFVLRCSSAYRNPAQGFEGDDFVNLVVTFDTRVPLPEVLRTLKLCELLGGKDLSAPRFASKTIDVDLLYFGDTVIRHDRLQLPPVTLPDYYVRGLAELAPDWVDPATGIRVRELPHDGARATAVTLPQPAETGTASLRLPVHIVRVHLGVGAAERRVAQRVELDIRLDFAGAPGACVSDDVAETVDYAELAGALTETLEGPAFRTVEHLAREAMNQVIASVQGVARVALAVHKFPPVPGLEGGARFELVRSLP